MFRLEIETDNAAFDDNPGEIVRILREVADHVEQWGPLHDIYSYTFKDINGNTVARAQYTR